MSLLYFPPLCVSAADYSIVGAVDEGRPSLNGTPSGGATGRGHLRANLTVALFGEAHIRLWRSFVAQAPGRTIALPVFTKYRSRNGQGLMVQASPRTTEMMFDRGQPMAELERPITGSVAVQAIAQASRITVTSERIIEAGGYVEIGKSLYLIGRAFHDGAGRQVLEVAPRLRWAIPPGEPVYCDMPFLYCTANPRMGRETASSLIRVTASFVEDVRYAVA